MRNVLKYFSPVLRREITERVAKTMKPRGFLVVGATGAQRNSTNGIAEWHALPSTQMWSPSRGELLDADEERFSVALEKLKRSRSAWTTVDMGGVTNVTHAPMRRLVYAWFDVYCEHRPPYISAPEIVWAILGDVALDTEIERWKAEAGA